MISMPDPTCLISYNPIKIAQAGEVSPVVAPPIHSLENSVEDIFEEANFVIILCMFYMYTKITALWTKRIFTRKL